ncbi:tetratricopeptide repeat protein [Tenacibaculum amylolyticum]|uniref:tetratricopeptide repeat protein n=1 Tax=Tenacibaculum amylolyticum TaxID=104269 RepID=UPI003893FB86
MNLEDNILIEKFLRNEFSESERVKFLERIDTDTVFKKQFLLEQQLFESLDENDWSFIENIDEKEVKEYEALFRSEEIQVLKKTIEEATRENRRNEKGRIIRIISGVAAAVVLLLFIFKPFSTNNSLQLYAESEIMKGLPSFPERGNNEANNDLITGEKLFKEQKYKEAVSLFDAFLLENKDISGVYIYIAVANIELKDYDRALTVLDSLINSDLIDGEKGYWYKSLLYIKSKQLKKAKKTLQLIIDKKYYKYKEAIVLLDKMN